jgi:predicted amidophosphoribosyltransferase
MWNLRVRMVKPFMCYNCGRKSTNTGCFTTRSNERQNGKLCVKCEREFARQDLEDTQEYNNQRTY